MRNLLYIFAFIVTGILYSCNEANQPALEGTSTGDKVKVVLNITNLSDNKLTRSTTQSEIKKIIYAVYKGEENTAAGDEIMILKDSLLLENNPASIISLDLQPGKYVVAVFASGRRNADINNYNDETLQKSLLNVDDMTSSAEFYGTTSIEIQNQSISKSITLDRIVGKVEIVVKDLQNASSDITGAMPVLETYGILNVRYDIKPFRVRLNSHLDPIFSLGGQNGESFKHLAIKRVSFSEHNENNPIQFYCLQTSERFSVENFRYSVPSLHLELTSPTPTPSHTILITNKMLVYPNKITRYTGSIQGDNNQGFNISVIDEWSDDIETVVVEKEL